MTPFYTYKSVCSPITQPEGPRLNPQLAIPIYFILFIYKIVIDLFILFCNYKNIYIKENQEEMEREKKNSEVEKKKKKKTRKGNWRISIRLFVLAFFSEIRQLSKYASFDLLIYSFISFLLIFIIFLMLKTTILIVINK